MGDSAKEISRRLFRSDLKYADVIGAFRSLSEKKRKSIAKKHGSFAEWITSPANQLPTEGSLEFTYRIHKVIKDKVKLGVVALGSMVIAKIEPVLMRASGFVSEALLRRIFRRFTEFEVYSSGKGDRVRLAAESVGLVSKETNPTPRRADDDDDDDALSDRRKEQLMLIYRCHPDVVVTLTPSVTWSLILKSHAFWQAHCSLAGGTLADWLMDMAGCQSKETFEDYERALTLCFVRRAIDLVKDRARTVRDLTENLCISHSRLISDRFLLKCCEMHQELLAVVHSDEGSVAETLISLNAGAGLAEDCFHPPSVQSLGDCKSNVPGSTNQSSANSADENERQTAGPSSVVRHRASLQVTVDAGGKNSKTAATECGEYLSRVEKRGKVDSDNAKGDSTSFRPCASANETAEAASDGAECDRSADGAAVACEERDRCQDEATMTCDSGRDSPVEVVTEVVLLEDISDEEMLPEDRHKKSTEPDSSSEDSVNRNSENEPIAVRISVRGDENAVACSATAEVLNLVSSLKMPSGAVGLLSGLMTCDVRFSDLLCSFATLLKTEPHFVEQATSVHGCFLEFLVQHAVTEKHQICAADYRSALHEQLTLAIDQKWSSSLNNAKKLDALLALLNKENGFVDRKFLLQAIEARSSQFRLVNDAVTVVNNRSKACKKSLGRMLRRKSPIPRIGTDNKLREICAMPRLRYVAGKKLSFAQMAAEYALLSNNLQRRMVESGSSFFDVLEAIACEERSMLYDDWRAHFNTIVFKEVYRCVQTKGPIKIAAAAEYLSADRMGLLSTENVDTCVKASLEGPNARAMLRISPPDFLVLVVPPLKQPLLPLPHALPSWDSTLAPLLSSPDVFQDALHLLGAEIGELLVRPGLDSSSRLASLLGLLKSLVKPLLGQIINIYGSFWGFIVKWVRVWYELCKVICDVVEKLLGTDTWPAAKVHSAVCGDNIAFITRKELVQVLAGNDCFVVVDCSETAYLVSAVRRQTNGKVLFCGKHEKCAVESFANLFGAVRKSALIDDLFHRAWYSSGLNGAQRSFVFGKIETSSKTPLPIHRDHFRRFIRIFPSVFKLFDDDSVLLNFDPREEIDPADDGKESKERLSGERSDCSKKNAANLLEARRAKKRVRLSEERNAVTSPKSRKTERQRKRKTVSKPCQKVSVAGQDDQDAKATGKVSNKCDSEKEVETNSLSDNMLPTFPQSLIQHVSMGRLLAANGAEMTFDDLVDSLILSLFTEDQKKKFKDDQRLRDSFRRKTTDVLMNAAKIQLLEPDGTGFFRKAQLKIATPSCSELSSSSALPVTRSMSRLTGVSNSRLSDYVASVASINNQPTPLDILLSLVQQHFSEKKVTPSTSDEVLNSQVMCCLKSRPEFVVNPADETFCLLKDCKEKPVGLKNSFDKICDEEILTFIGNFLEGAGEAGVGIEKLSDEAFAHFAERLDDAQKSVMMLVVRGLVGNIPRVGFRLDGRVTLLPSGSEESDNSSSADEEGSECRYGEEEDSVGFGQFAPVDDPIAQENDDGRTSDDDTETSAGDDDTGTSSSVSGSVSCGKAHESWPKTNVEVKREQCTDFHHPEQTGSTFGSNTDNVCSSMRGDYVGVQMTSHGGTAGHQVSSTDRLLTPTVTDTPADVDMQRFPPQPLEKNLSPKAPRHLDQVIATDVPHCSQDSRGRFVTAGSRIEARKKAAEWSPAGDIVNKPDAYFTTHYQVARADSCESDNGISSTSGEPASSSGGRKPAGCRAEVSENGVSSTSSLAPAPSTAQKGSYRERQRKIRHFLSSYLTQEDFCAETQKLLEMSKEHFSGERFARSTLALRGYVLEHLAESGPRFVFSNRFGGPGATWVFYRPNRTNRIADNNNSISLPYTELLPEIITSCKAHLISAPKNRENLSNLTSLVVSKHGERMLLLDDDEKLIVSQYLVLIGCLKSLEFFVFAKTEPIIFIRRETVFADHPLHQTEPHAHPSSLSHYANDKSPASRSRAAVPPSPASPPPSRAAKTRPKVSDALHLVTRIIRTRGPITKTELRDTWSAEASKDLHKVLGSGVSFTLAFRKFQDCFPVAADGTLTVNEAALEQYTAKLV